MIKDKRKGKKKWIVLVIFILLLIYFAIKSCRTGKNKEKTTSANNKYSKAKKIKKKKELISVIRSRIKRNETILDILRKNNVERKEAYQLVNEVKSTYNLAKIKYGNKYIIKLKKNKFYKLNYYIDSDNFLEVVYDKGSFKANLKQIKYDIKTEIIKVRITYSLFDAIKDAGEKLILADLFASLYEYDINFNRDLRKGDILIAKIQKKYSNDKLVKYGKISASSFINSGKRINIIGYEYEDGKFEYFHPDGKTVRKMFLKSPLPFMRITSRFGYRIHPVLGYSKRHTGVDLGAPVGTLVRATAKGNILKTGYDRVRGRFVIIKHPNAYRTHYYHLSKIRRGIKRAKSVPQSYIIGYVGNTGRSTGPHLHYGIQKNRRYINPLTLDPPSIKTLPEDYMDNFKQHTKKLLANLDKHLKIKNSSKEKKIHTFYIFRLIKEELVNYIYKIKNEIDNFFLTIIRLLKPDGAI